MIPKKNEPQKRSRIQERKAARNYEGQRTPGSGNGWIQKADVRTDEELFELKTTSKSQFALRSSDLYKLWNAALLDSRTPVFEIEFANDGITCVVLDKNDYLAMRENG